MTHDSTTPPLMTDAPERSPSQRELQVQELLDDPLRIEDLDDASSLVPELPAQGFVRVARRLQQEHRLDLVLAHATPDQITSLLDLDAWVHDRLIVTRARMWLLAIAELYSGVGKPRGALVELMYGMDPEIWTLALGVDTQVMDLDPHDDGARDEAHDRLAHLLTWDSPDGFFVVGVPDDENGRMALATIDHVYSDDLAEGRKLLLSIQSMLEGQIEEDLLRWRSGRLADLGFVEWEEAMKLFRPYDHRAAAEEPARDFAYLKRENEALTPVTWVSAGLLRRVMNRLDDAEHGVRSREFLLLVAEVMAAQRFPAGDERLQERAIDQTQSTVSLGLELLLTHAPPSHAPPELSGPSDPEAFLAERVRAIGLRDVFRVGYGALDKLRKAVAALQRTARVSLTAPGSLLDRPWGPAIAALGRWYPEVPISASSKGTRPLRTFADVREATRFVAEAGALARLCFESEGFAIDPIWITRVDEPERLVLGDLVRTAMVQAQLHHAPRGLGVGGSRVLAPLTPEDLGWAAEHLLQGREIAAEVRRDLSRRCDALGIGEHTEALAQNLLTRMRVELAQLEVGDKGTPDLTRAGGFLTIQQVGMWLKTSAPSN
jgi:hypothetical protein